MGFKTLDEMINSMTEYGSNFHTVIPERFAVHGDYLNDGLTEQSFSEGYRAYQVKMREFQSDMCTRPEDYGLIAYEMYILRVLRTVFKTVRSEYSRENR